MYVILYVEAALPFFLLLFRNDLNFRYKKLMETLESKRTDVEQMSSEFEAKLREKEDEQHSIKKELASLAIKMNMEAQKKRHHQADYQRLERGRWRDHVEVPLYKRISLL